MGTRGFYFAQRKAEFLRNRGEKMKTDKDYIDGIVKGLEEKILEYKKRLDHLKETQKMNAIRIREMKGSIAHLSSGGYSTSLYQRKWKDARVGVNHIEEVRAQVRELMRETRAHLRALTDK